MTSSAYDPLEDESCREFVLPALEAAGWRDEQIRPAYAINRGRIHVTAFHQRQDQPLIADYVLEYSDGLPIAIIEANRTWPDPADGVEQVRRYAELLDIPFAYTTNGIQIHEIAGHTGLESGIPEFPSPDELWERYRQQRGLDSDKAAQVASAPLNHALQNPDGTPTQPRYYQQIAVNRVVQAIAKGDRRLLLVLATGTGKSLVAAQVVAKLWNAAWPGDRRPRVLYLADRRILIDQMTQVFLQMFDEEVHRISDGDARADDHLHVALYQSLTSATGSPCKGYAPDFFDLVIVDECRQGNASENSRWRVILEHFSPAVQLGFTTTPVTSRDAGIYDYFGAPRYEYSLARGIDDGLLAPYRVRRVRMNVDLAERQSGPGLLVPQEREAPVQLYLPGEYERTRAILEHTDEAARYLRDYMTRTGRLNKMIIFCQDIEHADRMAKALRKVNSDLIAKYGEDYVCRITGDDGDVGRAALRQFQQPDTVVPTIAVTSRLLSAGVDIPTLRTVVLFRIINSVAEFTQIVGRGTRLFPEDDKFSFDIVDFVQATRLFQDPRFDGPPLMLLRDETNDEGRIFETIGDTPTRVMEPQADYNESPGGPLPAADAAGQHFRGFVRDQVLSLKLEPSELLKRWGDTQSRKTFLARLAAWRVTTDDLAKWTGHPESDPIDMLLFITWQLPLISRAERAFRLKLRHRNFLDAFTPEAREVLDMVLDQYMKEGPGELDADALQADVYHNLDTDIKLASRFHGRDKLHAALEGLSRRLYSPA